MCINKPAEGNLAVQNYQAEVDPALHLQLQSDHIAENGNRDHSSELQVIM